MCVFKRGNDATHSIHYSSLATCKLLLHSTPLTKHGRVYQLEAQQCALKTEAEQTMTKLHSLPPGPM